MRWKSFAEWDEAVFTNSYGQNITEDIHPTERAALSVCKRLNREGFGGERQHFPIRTWTKETCE